jgi:hypothetical protein
MFLEPTVDYKAYGLFGLYDLQLEESPIERRFFINHKSQGLLILIAIPGFSEY